MNSQFYQTYVPNPFIPTFNPTINSSRIDYPSSNSKQQPEIRDQSIDQTNQNNVLTTSFNINAQTNKSVILKPILMNQDDYSKKLNELEQSYKDKQRELEQKMQTQIEALQSKKYQDDQYKQMTDVKQQLYELQSSLLNQNQSAPQVQYEQQIFYQQHELERMEKQLKKKKNKIKDQKVIIENLKSELISRQQKITELEIKLHYSETKPIIQQPPRIISMPQPVIQHPSPQIISDSPELLDRLRSLEIEREGLLSELRRVSSLNYQPAQKQSQSNLPSIDEWNKLMHEYKLLETENSKLNTIILQKNDLIKSLEQRISIELTKQSALQAQGNQPRTIQVVYDPQTQQQQMTAQLYPITVQQTEQNSNIEPTLQTNVNG